MIKAVDIKTNSDIISFINENKILILGSNIDNKIEMIGNKISIILNGEVVFSRILDTESILRVAETILYSKLELPSLEYDLSPLEADREDGDRSNIWVVKQEKITIPYFTQTYLLYVAFKGTIPTMYEFGLFYKEAYTREISVKEKDSRDFVYLRVYPDDRCWVGEIFDFDEHKVENTLLRFKEEFNIKNLPIYDFTTRQLYKRIYNNFGSISRDFCNVLTFDKNGADVYYSSKEDSEGYDMIVNEKSFATFNDTSSGKSLRKDKVDVRHSSELKNDVELLVSIENNNKLTLLEDEVALFIIERINNLNDNKTIPLRTRSIKDKLKADKETDLSWMVGFSLN